MAQAAVNKERSFPHPEFTDSEAGALTFPSSTSRSYNYYKPAKARATTYDANVVALGRDARDQQVRAGADERHRE